MSKLFYTTIINIKCDKINKLCTNKCNSNKDSYFTLWESYGKFTGDKSQLSGDKSWNSDFLKYIYHFYQNNTIIINCNIP